MTWSQTKIMRQPELNGQEKSSKEEARESKLLTVVETRQVKYFL
jgi:hypothetical protein